MRQQQTPYYGQTNRSQTLQPQRPTQTAQPRYVQLANGQVVRRNAAFAPVGGLRVAQPRALRAVVAPQLGAWRR